MIPRSQPPESGIVQEIVQCFAGLFWATTGVDRGDEPEWVSRWSCWVSATAACCKRWRLVKPISKS